MTDVSVVAERTRTQECPACAAQFSYAIGPGTNRKYCSRRCYLDAQRLSRRAASRLAWSSDVRKRVCGQCGTEFQYQIGRGADRRLCSDFCRTRQRHANAKAKPLCVVEGCRNNRGYRDGLCNPCHSRFLQTGTIERRQWAYRAKHTSGYVLVSDRTHPLANATGMIFEHRKVLFEAIGLGPHPCRWCNTPVDWVKGKCVKGALVPDHLDGDKANNALTNLVPSCNRCNATRGLFMSWVRRHKDDPWLWVMYQDATVAAAATGGAR